MSLLLVDGHNVLLTLAARDGVPDSFLDLRGGERELVALLEEWARLRVARVVIAWDGRASQSQPGERVREVRLEPPAEADDFLVLEAHRARREGLVPTVVSRDRGLLARLPAGSKHMSLTALVDDLEALLADPIRAPHVRALDADWQALERHPADPRYPRRQTIADPAPALSATPPVSPRPSPPADPTVAAAQQAAIEQKRAARRARFARAQQRKKR